MTGPPGARRYPCDFCGLPDRWPDGCSETPDAPDPGCARVIERRCMDGDHRRCAQDACVVAGRWHEEVRRAGVEAATAAGTHWAVVSTIANRVEVVRTGDHLGRARSLQRNGALRRAGVPLDPEHAGLVHVVRVTDGALF